MARFIDLEVEDEPDSSAHPSAHPTDYAAANLDSDMQDAPMPDDTAMARAFQCYPIAISIVSSIDLTSLDSLARTNRATYSSLIQFRGALISSTLRCSNETVPLDPEETLRYRARAIDGTAMSNTAKASSCARDMVSECRRCNTVICRNCAIKPPSALALRERHRRICKTCTKSPLTAVASPPLDADMPWESDAFKQSMCNCASGGAWLCQPCGRAVRNADNDYLSIWRWRVQYGETLGCLGTGIGDGDRGVICGKETECLAARYKEQEMDCDAEDAKGSAVPSVYSQSDASGSSYASSSSSSGQSPPDSSYFPANASFANQSVESLVEEFRHSDRTPSPLHGPGYERHEIEGIGGIVKRKIVRMVRVGACVAEWQDEKSSYPGSGASRVLGHEVRGDTRSWCGWCSRVVPGKKDLADMAARDASAKRPAPVFAALPIRPAMATNNTAIGVKA